MPAIRPIAQTNVGSLRGSFGNGQGRNASPLMVANSARSSSSVIGALASRSASAYSACAGSSTAVGFMHGGNNSSGRRYSRLPHSRDRSPISNSLMNVRLIFTNDDKPILRRLSRLSSGTTWSPHVRLYLMPFYSGKLPIRLRSCSRSSLYRRPRRGFATHR